MEELMRKMYGYARVSTREQNLDRQILALQKFGIGDRDIIRDKASGKTLDREGYKLIRNHLLREGDSLVIMSLDRLSRNKLHIRQELEYYKEHRIRVMILDMPTTLTEVSEGQEWIIDMINNILIEVLSSIAEQERMRTLQRQAQGIEAAKQKGKHLGRPQIAMPSNWNEVYALWKNHEISGIEAMKRTGLKRSSFYKLIHNMEAHNTLE